MFNKIAQYDAMMNDFKDIKEDEQLLIAIGGRTYVIRLANQFDLNDHDKDN